MCKPCWELHYCPYGPVVEDFPLLPVLQEAAVEHNQYLKKCLGTGILGSGAPIDDARKEWLPELVQNFDKDNYPSEIPKVLLVCF